MKQDVTKKAISCATKYDEVAKIYGNGFYVVKQNENQVLVDKEGIEVLKSGFDEIWWKSK